MRFSIVRSAFNTAVWFFTTTYFVGPLFWRHAGQLVGEENEYLQVMTTTTLLLGASGRLLTV